MVTAEVKRSDVSAMPEFAEYAGRVRPGLERALAAYLATVTESVSALPVDVRVTVDCVRDLALRGGKRLRAVLLAAGYEACGGQGGADQVVMAGVSLELLQVYLLIHDDWMDADDVRRGGPSVPAMLRKQIGPRSGGIGPGLADSLSVLAGDFAAGLALDALSQVAVPPARVAAASREMGRIQRDVVLGQMCDLQGSSAREPPTEAAVELTHTLKTGSYTVRGPLALGAHLAGANDETVRALDGFATPLGVAFQLRDDVLGTFGDPAHTGKPSTGDIRQGKRTALIAALGRDQEAAPLLARTFGNPEASPTDTELLVARMVTSGARRRVEERIDELLGQAAAALELVPIATGARELLRGATRALGHRET